MHRRYCCKKGEWGLWNKPTQGNQSSVAHCFPAEPAKPAEPAAPAAPANKMRRVMVGPVEIMGEDGATVTIAGVPITFN